MLLYYVKRADINNRKLKPVVWAINPNNKAAFTSGTELLSARSTGYAYTLLSYRRLREA